MDFNAIGGGGGRVQFLQAQLFPICTLTPANIGAGRGFLGTFLSKGLKTNQLELNTDEKTLRPIARLKEPRDLFALPKDKDNDCSQQAPRWPMECQVIEERITHMQNVYTRLEPLLPGGCELRPRPVGEENGIVVFHYNPISAVNYEKKKRKPDSSDSDNSSSESRGSTPENNPSDQRNLQLKTSFAKLLDERSSSNSNDEEDEDDDDDDDDDDGDENDPITPEHLQDHSIPSDVMVAKKHRKTKVTGDADGAGECEETKNISNEIEIRVPSDNVERLKGGEDTIDDIWANDSPEYMPATPNYIKSKFSMNAFNERIMLLVPQLDMPINSSDDAAHSSDEQFFSSVSNSEVGGDNGDKTLRSSSIQTDIKNQEAQDKTSKASSAVDEISRTMKASPNLSVEQTKSMERKLLDRTLEKEKVKLLAGISPVPTVKDICVGNISNRSNRSSLKSQQKQSNEKPLDINQLYSTYAPTNKSKTQIQFLSEDSTNSEPLSQLQFSRSAVGGSKFLTNCHPYNPEEYDGLEFESRFESGNLAKAVKITNTYYELYLRSDLYTSRSKQWFYFRVRKTKKNMIYRFSIVNLVKSDSLYNDGMRPLMYSTINAKNLKEGWRRCGENICYYKNDDDNNLEEDDENSSYTLTFNIEFGHDDDTVYFAHCYPYTYSDLQDYLMDIQKNPLKSKFCKLRLLCRTLAGNNVYYLTVTAPTESEEQMKRKKAVVVSARVHPSETPASWMMKGLMDFITGESPVAKRLRHKFIFKLIPMLNPDGVIVGNTRNSLTGKDLNRQYRTVIRETYPSIWYTKAMIKRLIDECGVAMYCDMHAHSRKHNIFIYGCENKRNPEKKLKEQVFPLMMHKNVADKFSFESCKFNVQRSKEGTGRIVVWMLGITNSYTIEASFGGSSLGSRKGTHFNTADYEHMGRAFCETLLDYCDENPNKERLRLKIIERLLKEGSSADEPLNIPLSDYSSDEGHSSSSSDNEGKSSNKYSDLEGPCCAPLRAPPCSPEEVEHRRKKIALFSFTRMRKIMRELDRVYFTPLFHKRYQQLLRNNKKKQKKRLNKKSNKKQLETTNESAELVQSQTENKIPNQNQDQFQNQEPTLYNEQNHNSEDQKNIRSKEVALNEQTRRPKISRTLRLFLAKRKIIIYRKRFKSRKVKIRTKSKQRRKHSKDTQRTPLDLPTTDPGSDIHFSTDDELCDDANNPYGSSEAVGGSYSTIPRTRKILLQSELQRRYIEEIGDGSEILRRMPPELIVTSPTKSKSLKTSMPQVTSRSAAPKTAPEAEKGMLKEFPMLSMGGSAGLTTATRRTNSWHNLHNSGKCVPKIKIQNPYAETTTSSSEELQLKLFLKKKPWTGVNQDQSNFVERNRPLSWGMPPVSKNLQKPEKAHTSARSNKVKDENEMLLNACSQKLLAWQTNNDNNNTNNLPLTRGKLMLNLVMPEITSEEKTLRHFHELSKTKRLQKVGGGVKMDHGGEGKPMKKKKISLSRVADATQLVNRFSSGKISNSLNNVTSGATTIAQRNKFSSTTLAGISKNGQLQHIRKQSTNRFRTGGIVATAVQPSASRSKSKKLITLSSSKNSKLPQSMDKVVGPTLTKFTAISNNFQIALETATLARKAQKKFKSQQKKKAPARGAAAAADGDDDTRVAAGRSHQEISSNKQTKQQQRKARGSSKFSEI